MPESKADEPPKAMPTRILAVDFGDRRTGLAATDDSGTIAVPLPALVGLPDPECGKAIAELASSRNAEVVVVGLPLDTTGAVGKRATRTLNFVGRLRGLVSCSVETCDERDTTAEAHELLREGGIRASKRRKLADSVAALVILNRFRHGR